MALFENVRSSKNILTKGIHWDSLLTSDVVNTSMMRFQSKICRQWIQQKPHNSPLDTAEQKSTPPASTDSTSAISSLSSSSSPSSYSVSWETFAQPVYEPTGKLRGIFRRRFLTTEELEHPFLRSQQETTQAITEAGNPSLTFNFQRFRCQLEIFTHGLLRGLDYSNVVLGGGALLAALLPAPEVVQQMQQRYETICKLYSRIRLPTAIMNVVDEFVGSKKSLQRKISQALQEHYASLYPSADIDLFLVTNSLKDADEIVQRIYRKVCIT